ncbi:MAG: hypothetical protein AAGF66_19805 [Cyanobacteria bacterium P01_H01_bin.119]
MNFEIIPKDRVGPVRLGMSQSQIREALGVEGSSFRPIYHEGLWEDFPDLGLQICYNNITGENCIAVILTHPANPIFQDRELFSGESIEVLGEQLSSIDLHTEIICYEILSRELGIYIYAEEDDYGDDDNEYKVTYSVCSVTIFKEPYDISLGS